MNQLTEQDRLDLGRLVINTLDDWGINSTDQVVMLALPGKVSGRHLRRYQDDTPLPDDPEVLKRVEHLLGIADALRTTFPRNEKIAVIWLSQPCRRLRRRRPVDIMLEDGLSGLITVRTHLDCSFAWRESERTD
ncbi:MAG TPA: antitoxin Xre/MbcA/ParS toxin-binding domain-containing protein [Gammaproteobacteria bacterium]|nr:antitoxin Xre/MbcA/ParS toxin-binding domain-containing protein [Gammaproteobacteria bacterium]